VPAINKGDVLVRYCQMLRVAESYVWRTFFDMGVDIASHSRPWAPNYTTL